MEKNILSMSELRYWNILSIFQKHCQKWIFLHKNNSFAWFGALRVLYTRSYLHFTAGGPLNLSPLFKLKQRVNSDSPFYTDYSLLFFPKEVYFFGAERKKSKGGKKLLTLIFLLPKNGIHGCTIYATSSNSRINRIFWPWAAFVLEIWKKNVRKLTVLQVDMDCVSPLIEQFTCEFPRTGKSPIENKK